MKYNKPEIVALGTAVSVIQAIPKSGGPTDGPKLTVTVNAYEADE